MEIALPDFKNNEERPAADAWVLCQREQRQCKSAFGVLSADCFPILVRSSCDSFAAAVHSGWRGSCAGIARKVIEKMRKFGAKTENLEVAIGPAAQACCYCVGTEVAEQIWQSTTSLASDFRMSEKVLQKKTTGQYFADLRTLLYLQMRSSGIAEDKIALAEECTICCKDFFSHRRQAEESGRQVSFISLDSH